MQQYEAHLYDDQHSNNNSNGGMQQYEAHLYDDQNSNNNSNGGMQQYEAHLYDADQQHILCLGSGHQRRQRGDRTLDHEPQNLVHLPLCHTLVLTK